MKKDIAVTKLSQRCEGLMMITDCDWSLQDINVNPAVILYAIIALEKFAQTSKKNIEI